MLRVLTFDPRGNGRSDRPRDPAAYDRREWAEDAVAVLDVNGVNARWWSAGATRARRCTWQPDHPDRVAGLVLFSGYPLAAATIDDER